MDDIKKRMAAVISSIGEGAPESILYLGTGANIEEWNMLKHLLVSCGLVEEKMKNYITLTPKGQEAADQINAILARAV